MAIRVGSIAFGDDFFDRKTERQDMWRYLGGNHIVFSGPRRLGKSSILQRLTEEGREKGMLTRLIDVQGLDRAEDFITHLAAAFPENTVAGYLKKIGSAVRSLTSNTQVNISLPDGSSAGIQLPPLPETPWRDEAVKLQQRLAPVPVLILIDEFTVFLEKLLAHDKSEAERLLSWLRAWRSAPQTACRFVFSGSIGFDSLLEQHNLSTLFNDCHEFHLGPFHKDIALSMLKEVAWREEKWKLEDAVANHLCQRVGWLSPFYLNLLLDQSLAAGRDREMECASIENPQQLTTDDIENGYERLLSVRSRFIHWYKRLQRDLPEPDFSFACAVLSAVAREKSGQGLTRTQLRARLQRQTPDPDERRRQLDRILVKLQEDGYLGQTEERIAFLSFLLRDYWRRNHG
jgi:hypothetical protein